jgi:hypothetical protein
MTVLLALAADLGLLVAILISTLAGLAAIWTPERLENTLASLWS